MTDKLDLGPLTLTLEESHRQAVLLAIAKLAIARPGWRWMLGEIAEVLQGRRMFEEFYDMDLGLDVVLKRDPPHRFESVPAELYPWFPKQLQGTAWFGISEKLSDDDKTQQLVAMVPGPNLATCVLLALERGATWERV